MFTKTFITLTLIAFSFVAHAQDDFSSFCERAGNNADSLIANGIVYFPRIVTGTSLTLRKMLEVDYGIQDELYDNNSDMSFGGELECFYNKMKVEIERKWGEQFLEHKGTEANELDKKGIGYTEPLDNEVTAFLVSHLQREELEFDGYYVNFIIRPNGTISSFDILSGVPTAFQITKNSKDYRSISTAILEFDQKLIPGTLRGKPITSELRIWIEW